MDPGRRRFLTASALAAAMGALPRFAVAAASRADTRLLIVFLRGGMDGLHVLQPVGDPAYARLRGALADAAPPQAYLDGLFAWHPALQTLSTLYAHKSLLPVVAVAPPYRDRSHFEAQDCVENGTGGPGATPSGWLNRCVGAMPGGEGLALAAVMPMILRGTGNVRTWSPPLPDAVDPILMQRLQLLYAADPLLAPAFARVDPQGGASIAMRGTAKGSRLVQMADDAGRFMAAPQGPRIAFVEDTGWDTHGNEAAILAVKLRELDDAVQAFQQAAQPVWASTAVVIVSEFGRTAAVNGTGGTDHGTGGLAFVTGGAVRGGRIGGDWPGLAAGALNENRDLRTTTDMRALFKGLLRDHLDLQEGVIDRVVFPGSAAVRAMDGLVHA